MKQIYLFTFALFTLLFLQRCDRDSWVSHVEGNYSFTIHSVSETHVPNQYSVSDTTYVSMGKVERTKYREVKITFGNGAEITRKLDNDGSIVPVDVCCEERGKFDRGTFTWHEKSVQLSHTFTDDITGQKQ